MVSIRVIVSLLILLGTVGAGTAGFHYIEELAWSDAFYLTVVTVTTVGYGDIVPETSLGQMFAIPVIIVGVASALSSMTLIFGAFLEERVRRAVSGLAGPREYRDHVIICGRGVLADVVAKELGLNGVPFVRIVRETEPVVRDAIVGDPSEDEVLLDAGIDQAMSLVSLMDEDADNAFVILEAKRLQPHLRVISIAKDPENKAKLEEMGADMAIASDLLAARLLALSSENHFTLDFFDTELSSRSIALSEISIPEGSAVVGKSLVDLDIPRRFGVSVVAISRGGQLVPNPDPSVAFEEGGQILVFGERSKAMELRSHITGGRGPTPGRVQTPPAAAPKPLAHEFRMRAPRIMTNLFVIAIILVLNQLAAPIFSAAGLTIQLPRPFGIGLSLVAMAAIGYLLIQVLGDLKVLVDLGMLRAMGLGGIEAPAGKDIMRNVILVAIIVVLGIFVSPVLGYIGGLAGSIGAAIPWVCLVLLVLVLYDVGSYLHGLLKKALKTLVDGFAKRLEEGA